MQTLEQVAQILTQAAVVSSAETKRIFTKQKNERRLHAYYNECRIATVRGGFPILVWMDVREADRDVGFKDEWIADYEFSTTSYGSVSFLKLTQEEKNQLIDSATDKYFESR
jgi:hypothetical protein